MTNEQDKVIKRIPIYLSQLSSVTKKAASELIAMPPEASETLELLTSTIKAEMHKDLYLMQFPLTQQSPLTAKENEAPGIFRLKKESGVCELRLPLKTNSVVYDKDAGERYGFASQEMDSMNEGNDQLQNNLSNEDGFLDKVLLEGNPVLNGSGRCGTYLVGVVKNDGIHLNALKSVVRFRPCLKHLDANDTMAKRHESEVESGSEIEDNAKKQKNKKEMLEKKQEVNLITTAFQKRLLLKRRIEEEEWEYYGITEKSEDDGKDTGLYAASYEPLSVLTAKSQFWEELGSSAFR